jgi:hypothetical protein
MLRPTTRRRSPHGARRRRERLAFEGADGAHERGAALVGAVGAGCSWPSVRAAGGRRTSTPPPRGTGDASGRSRRQILAYNELDLVEVAAALLRRLHAADDALAPAVPVVEDDFDRLHAIGCAPSGRAAEACYSDQLGAQGRVDALCESGAYEAAAALAGREADAHIVVDDDVHPSADERSVAVGPSPGIALLEDHANEQTAWRPASEWLLACQRLCHTHMSRICLLVDRCRRSP